MYRALPIVKKALDPVCANVPDTLIGIHGTLYDANDFDHPGGATFLRVAMGTDATALFETHHLNAAAAHAALTKLKVAGSYVPKVEYDFEEYRPVRAAALSIFPTRASRRMDAVSFLWMCASIASTAVFHVASLCASVGSLRWFGACVGAAYLNSICGGYGHNGLHRLEGTALLLDWNGLSCYEWLFEHLQSHHMYVNTDHDHDSISMEPFLRWIPHRRRAWPVAYASYVKHVIYLVAEIAVAVQGNFGHRTRWLPLTDSRFPRWLRLAPFVFVLRIGSYALVQGLWGALTALVTLGIAGYFFAYLAHLNHGFDGDGRPNFLMHQLKNTKDIKTVAGGSALLFLDRQTLHHLFPTIDHTRWTLEVRDMLKVSAFMRMRSVGELHAHVERTLTKSD